MTNEEILKTEYDELETKLDKLIDDNESGKIDDAQFSILVAILQMRKKLLPYHEELQNLETELFDHFGLIFNLTVKQSTPKEEQEIKHKIKEIKNIFNNFKGTNGDKKQQISEIAEQIDNLLLEIVGLLT